MKSLSILFLSIFLISSCVSIQNYQVFETEFKNLKLEDELLVYEDQNCKVSYNLWSENGNPSFLFQNNSDSTIIVDLSDCFFIMNGISYDYFQNRTYTYSSSFSNSKTISNTKTNIYGNEKSTEFTNLKPTLDNKINTGAKSTFNQSEISVMNGYNSTVSKGSSITFNENRILKIPANSGKIISEFELISTRYRNCDLFKIPKNESGIDSVVFNDKNSPLTFINQISYQFDTLSSSKTTFTNEFYVRKVMNMTGNNFYERDFQIGCDGIKNESYPILKYRFEKPNNFYLPYLVD